MTNEPNTQKEKKTTLGIVFLTLFIDLIGFSIIFPLFPAMLEFYIPEGATGLWADLLRQLQEIAGTDNRVQCTVLFGGFLGSLYSFLQFIAAPFWGRLSDKIGRRPILIISISGLILSYALWAFSSSFGVFIISRLIGGFMGGNISTASAAVADITDEASRAKGMGTIGAAFGLGFILGPFIGGVLSAVQLVDPTTVTSGSLIGLHQFSTPAIAAMVLCVLNLLWVLKKFKETLPEGNRNKGHESKRSLNPLFLFGYNPFKGVRNVNWINFLFLFAFSGMEFTLTFFAVDRFKYSNMDNAYMFVFVGLVIAIVQGGFVRRLAPKMGEKKLGNFGLLMVIPGMILLSSSTSGGMLYLSLGLLAVGSAFVQPCMSALVSRYADNDSQGEVMGVFRSLGALARAFGPIIACLVYWKFGPASLYYVCAGLVILPFLIGIKLNQPANQSSK